MPIWIFMAKLEGDGGLQGTECLPIQRFPLIEAKCGSHCAPLLSTMVLIVSNMMSRSRPSDRCFT